MGRRSLIASIFAVVAGWFSPSKLAAASRRQVSLPGEPTAWEDSMMGESFEVDGQSFHLGCDLAVWKLVDPDSGKYEKIAQLKTDWIRYAHGSDLVECNWRTGELRIKHYHSSGRLESIDYVRSAY